MPINRGRSSSSALGRASASNVSSDFARIVSHYLEGLLDKSEGIPELEIRFGTRGNAPTTRENFDGVLQKLLSSGFTFIKKNAYSLKIQNEFIDQKTGQTKLSLIRAEIHGINDVQNYCKTNMPDERYVLFTQKMYAKTSTGAGGDESTGTGTGTGTGTRGDTIHPVIFDDFNFKVSFQREKRIANTSTLARSILKTWNDNKKTFRYINRTTLKHPDFPFQIDMSVVKESHKDRTGYISASTFEAARVLESPIRYEIEIEVINDLVGPGTAFNHPKHLLDHLRKMIKIVMSGFQGTNYPVSLSDIRQTQRQYYELLHPDEREHNDSSDSNDEHEHEHEDEHDSKGNDKHKYGHNNDNRHKHISSDREVQLRNKHFIGPCSYTLQMENIRPIDSDSRVPNIRVNYCVTEKADGQRKLLFIAPKSGYVYLIDTNMNFQFTGAVSLNTKLHNSLLDGEHITNNKSGHFINLFLAFDVYFVHKADIRSRLFFPVSINEDEVLTNFRLPLMETLIKNLQLKCVSGSADSLPPIRIESKQFEIASVGTVGNSEKSIFECCATVLRKCQEHYFEYNTDGLVFTPIDFGVGSTVRNDNTVAGPLYKTTWEYSFKWKPSHMNTIDFLVTTKKSDDTEDLISNIFKSGIDMSRCVQIQQYKTLVLRIGYDEKKHGHLNPCVSMIEGGDSRSGDSSSSSSREATETYKPAPFYPTYPYDDQAHICHIMLRPDEAGVNQMMTLENDVFQDETIVEFSYDATQPVNWRWVPLRVRHDKTAEYRSGGKNYGNAYHVANSNWHSIHNPITPEMIMTGEGIPDEIVSDDIYYNHTELGGGKRGSSSIRTLTKSMRDFHNLFIKRKLIMSVSRPGYTLIDLAVGKGGDLPKWISAKLGFVFGIDYSKDNLEHKFDGVCARYLDVKRTKRNIPDAIFIHGDSSKEIRSGQAAISERYRMITRAIFGEGAKDASVIGRGVYPHYGRGADGFDICSVQFAIHYFFENTIKVHTFLQNVSECTKLGGYFIGTCFDGGRIFQALSRLETGDELSVLRGGSSSSDPEKMWSVRKKYHQREFEPDSSSIGYEIEVYQDTINKATREYLVNFDYLTQLLENYGFDLVTPEEAETTLAFPMPDGSAPFERMFHFMESECKKKHNSDGSFAEQWKEYGSAMFMTPEEKQVSFYNRYFIFRKNRNINAKQLKNSFLSYAGLQEEHERAMTTTTTSKGTHDRDHDDDEATEKLALEKIAKASLPIDVATKPAIAAHILTEQRDEKVSALSGTMKIKPKPRLKTVKTTKAKDTTTESSSAVAPIERAPVVEEEMSAPIVQIEKKIQKRTKKTKISDTDANVSADVHESVAAVVPPKRKTKKKTDL
jgi:hypothetical protein